MTTQERYPFWCGCRVGFRTLQELIDHADREHGNVYRMVNLRGEPMSPAHDSNTDPCPVCGKWYRSVSQHMGRSHKDAELAWDIGWDEWA